MVVLQEKFFAYRFLSLNEFDYFLIFDENLSETLPLPSSTRSTRIAYRFDKVMMITIYSI